MSYFDSLGHASEIDTPQMSMKDYHASQAIGSSTAKLALKSMQLFDDARRGIYTQPDRPHFQIGTLAHMMTLEPEKFAQLVTCDGPINESTGKMYGRDTVKFQRWLDDRPGVTVVEPWLYTMLERMPIEVMRALEGTVREQSFFAELAGLQVKCRPDALKPGLILDLKTCVDVDRIERDIIKQGYWFTAAWYRAVMQSATGTSHDHEFIFVEKAAPYRWRIVTLDTPYIMRGDDVVEDVLGRIYHASMTGNYKDKSGVRIEASMPEWMNPRDEESDDEEGDDDGSY